MAARTVGSETLRSLRVLAAVVAVTVGVVVVPAPSSSRAQTASTPAACALLTPAEIQQVLARPSADGVQGAAPSSCKWTVAGGRPAGGSVDLTVFTGPRAELGYQELHQLYQASLEEVPGLGSAAFFVGGLGGTLFAEASSQAYFSLLVSFPTNVIPTDQVKGLAVALARAALPRAAKAGATPTATTTVPKAKAKAATRARQHSLMLRPTTDLTDNLVRRVDAKQWTMAKGITQTLAAALDTKGGAASRLVTGRRKLTPGDLTGTVLLAQQYLAKASDSAARRAIAAQLGKLVPTSAELEALAKPAAAGGPGRSVRRQTSVACSELWAGSEDVAALPGGCLQVDETTTAGAHLRIYTPTTPPPGFDAATFVGDAHRALVDSTTKYATFGQVGNIDLVYDPRGAATFDGLSSAGPTGNCVVLIEPYAVHQSPEYLRYVVAHESFHCFQHYRVPAYGEDYASQEWWVEGTAEHFANVVYPTYDFEYLQLGNLQADEPGHAVVDLSYSAFLFWQEFDNERGAAAIVTFLEALSGGGREAQIAQLAGVPGIGDLFDTYARKYLAGEIRDTSGSVHPFAVDIEDGSDVAGPGTFYDVQTQPFVIERIKSRFAEDHTFVTEVGAESAVHSAASPTWAREWGALPSPIDTKCADRAYILEATNATTETARFVAKVPTVSDHKCEIDTKVDPCLVGLWRLDNSTFDDAFQPMLGSTLTLLPTEGAIDLRFAPDGTGGSFANGLTSSYVDKKLVAPRVLTVRVRAQGKSEGRWSAEKGRIDFATGGSALRFVTDWDVDGKPFPAVTLPFNTDSLGSGFLSSGSYKCSTHDLDLATDGSPLGSLHWLRVS